MPGKSITKKTLRFQYGISHGTLMKWLRNVPGLNIELKKTRIFKPSELELIYKHLGHPDQV